MQRDRLKCSIWTNGGTGWGLKVLGNVSVRQANFDRSKSPVIVEIDGEGVEMNIDKDSFWNKTCGELINKAIRDFKDRHNLKAYDHVWLRVLEPFHRFRLEIE